MDSKVVNKKILENLNRAGAFDFTGETRAGMDSRLEQVLASASIAQQNRRNGQASFFDDFALENGPAAGGGGEGAAQVPEWEMRELFANEKELLGFYVTGHPLDAFRVRVDTSQYRKLIDLQDLKEGKKRYSFAGLVETMEVCYTRREGKPFAIMSIEDFTGGAEVRVWNDVYQKVSAVLVKGAVIELSASVEMDSRSDMRRLIAAGVRVLEAASEEIAAASALRAEEDESAAPAAGGESSLGRAEPLVLHLSCTADTTEDLMRIREVVDRHRENVPLGLSMRTASGQEVALAAGESCSVDRSEALLEELAPWLQGGGLG